MEYICNICNKNYSSYQSLWSHNKKFHSQVMTGANTNNLQLIVKQENKNTLCGFCKIELSNRQGRWRHEKKCKEKPHLENKSEIEKLNEKIQLLENKIDNKTKNIKNTNNGNIINGNGNIVKNNIIINKTGTENIDQLTYNEVSVIFDHEITSIILLIEIVNFNERKPENHSFCSTALESAYLSFYNTETKTIDKERKRYFYENIICKHIEHHEYLYGKYKSKFNSIKRKQIEDNIYNLKQIKANGFNSKIMLEIIRKLNLVSYNKRDLVQDTWNGKTIEYDNASDEEFMKLVLEEPDKKESSSSDDSSSEDYSLRHRNKTKKNIIL